MNITQHKNLISTLSKLIIEMSKKTVHLEKEELLLKCPICLFRIRHLIKHDRKTSPWNKI